MLILEPIPSWLMGVHHSINDLRYTSWLQKSRYLNNSEGFLYLNPVASLLVKTDGSKSKSFNWLESCYFLLYLLTHCFSIQLFHASGFSCLSTVLIQQKN